MSNELRPQIGLYKKPNGKIVLVQRGRSSTFKREVWQVYDGRRANSPIIRAFIPRVKDRPLMVMEGDSLGWGPTKYLNKCSYIGDDYKNYMEECSWLEQALKEEEGEIDGKMDRAH